MFWNKKKKASEDICLKCGQIHEKLQAIGFDRPWHYDELTVKYKNEIDEISEDFCIIRYSDQTDRFIRAVLSFQIIDVCETLDYGVWVSLSKNSYDDYEMNFKETSEKKTYFGRICNEIQDYKESTLGLHFNVITQNINNRPELVPHQDEHQLIYDWQNGISIEEALKRIENID